MPIIMQVVTVKSKFVLENQTGMCLEVKQRGTPDLNEDPRYGFDERCAVRLPHDSRCEGSLVPLYTAAMLTMMMYLTHLASIAACCAACHFAFCKLCASQPSCQPDCCSQRQNLPAVATTWGQAPKPLASSRQSICCVGRPCTLTIRN